MQNPQQEPVIITDISHNTTTSSLNPSQTFRHVDLVKTEQELICPMCVEVEKKKHELDQLYQFNVGELKKKHEVFMAGEKDKMEQERSRMMKELEEKEEQTLALIRSQQEALEKERQIFQQEKATRYKLEFSNKPVHLNVEGTVMTVALSYFISCKWEPNNLFKKMFSGEHALYETPTSTFQDKVFFIDCPLKVFELILSWLRYGSFEDPIDETIKYKLFQACLHFDLENLLVLLRKKHFNNDRIPVSQSFISSIERKRGTGIRFNGLNFNGFSFDDVELTDCEVIDCDLSNLVDGNKWIKTTFTKCNFSNVTIGFIDCVFNNCTFSKSKVEIGSTCSFTDCKMNEIELVKYPQISSSIAELAECEAIDCNFTNATFDVGCNATKCTFTKSKFNVASVFTECKLNEMDLSERDLTEFKFINVEFKTSNLSKCKMGRLSKQTFSNCNFSKCNLMEGLCDCTFSDCEFTGAQCTIEEGCSFTGCKMDGMDLNGQDFTKVEFINVDFTASNLSNCKMGKFVNPNLTDCNFNGTGLTVFSMLNLQQYSSIEKVPELSGKKVQLLFRASRDGFTAQAFHSKCIEKSPTITFIKSQYGYIFGGYTQAQWNSSGGYASDNHAFIFTFKNGNELQVFKVKDPSKAIYMNSLATFGDDISLYDQCNSNTSSYSNFGHSYHFPPGVTFGSSQSLLAGSYNFKVIEIETYQLLQ